jgi:hypothetical protein
MERDRVERSLAVGMSAEVAQRGRLGVENELTRGQGSGRETAEFHMRILDDVPFEISAEEVFGRLHLDSRSQYAGEVNAIIDRARQLARPRAVYEVGFVEERSPSSLEERLAVWSALSSRDPVATDLLRLGNGLRATLARGTVERDS